MGTYRGDILIFLTVISCYLFYQVEGHFLSVEDLEEFYDLEEKLAETFTKYIEEQKQTLEVIKMRYEEHRRRQPVVSDPEQYLGNPLNVVATLKRLVSDWPLTLALLGGALADEEEEESIRIPSLEEYNGAVHGIARIQQVYQYSREEIISGTAFPNTDNTSLFTVDDCIAVGKDFYGNRHYEEAIGWFKEALAQATNRSEGMKNVATSTENEPTSTPSPLEAIYEYLALATCFTGDEKQSKKYFRKLYTEFPDFRPTQSLIKDHLLALNDTCKKLIEKENLKPIDHMLKLSWKEDAKLSANYSQLCREVTHPPGVRSLHCTLLDWGDPYWLLHPFKVEEVHRDPDVFMVYDIIGPAERRFFMENMTDERDPSMNHGFVYEFWRALPDNSTLSESLVRRTEAFTGATVHNNRDQTRLATFPPGAEYRVGLDILPGTKNPKKTRLGSTIYFLQAPLAGGRVAFPRMGLTVVPVTGAALTWYNVRDDGSVQDRLAYGLCPVLQGYSTRTPNLAGKEPDKLPQLINELHDKRKITFSPEFLE